MSRLLGPDLLLNAYRHGVFPMAHSAFSDRIFWIDPPVRAILPLDGLHISRSLMKEIRAHRYDCRINSDFDRVIDFCAMREETWLNDILLKSYKRLHRKGYAHSIECWEGESLVGGLYGVALAGVFFGESMFSLKTNTSKLALVWLVEHLKRRQFALLDIQFLTDHLKTLGGVEIPKVDFQKRLGEALVLDRAFLD